jgi:hypothetical protein
VYLCKRQPNFAIFEAMELLIDILGWIGSVEVLIAYGLNVSNRLKSNSLAYILLNLTGGILLIIYSFYYSAFANTFINVVWAVVAIGAMVGYFRKR